MNRRSFFGVLAALPFAVKAVAAREVIPPPGKLIIESEEFSYVGMAASDPALDWISEVEMSSEPLTLAKLEKAFKTCELGPSKPTIYPVSFETYERAHRRIRWGWLYRIFGF